MIAALSGWNRRMRRPTPQQRPDSSRPTILIADDDPLVQRLICVTLDPRYDVTAVSDGFTAVKLARADHPDLVILDYILPGLHGYEACRQLKADPALSDQKVLLLTAYRDSGGSTRARAVGADEFLLKPFSPGNLLQVVDRLLAVERS